MLKYKNYIIKIRENIDISLLIKSILSLKKYSSIIFQ